MSISMNPTNQHVFISGKTQQDSTSLQPSSRDRNIILSVISCDAFAKLWDIRTGKAVQTFAGHESEIFERLCVGVWGSPKGM